MTKEEKLKYYGVNPLIVINETELSSSFENATSAFITEGLIKTYPIDRVIDMMSKLFNLTVIEGETKKISREVRQIIMDEELNNGIICKIKGVPNDETETIIFYVSLGEYNKELISKHMNKYGYFISSSNIPFDGVLKLQYEKKFDYDVTDIVNRRKYIYHICSENLKHKIKTQGITPHDSQWSNFKHTDRCYFFIDLDIDIIKKWADNFRDSKKQETKYMLLAIKVDKLNDNIKFYLDPRMKNGIYTLEGIKPDAIEIINTNL